MSSFNRPVLYSCLAVVAIITFFLTMFLHDGSNINSVPDHVSSSQNVPMNTGLAIVTQPAIIPPEIPRVTVPIRLKIPTIGVNAVVDQVGLTAQGAMGVPKGPTTVAWLDRSPRPGEIGNAVIDGHFGWFHNIPAVFDNLHKLRPGDVIIVENKNGTITFVVKELRLFDLHQDTGPVFVSSDGLAHLNLITCEGTWSQARQRYSNRLVVFADEQPG